MPAWSVTSAPNAAARSPPILGAAAKTAIERATAYARERVAFGKPIIEHQAVAFRLADMATSVAAAEQLVLHAAALRSAGSPCLQVASMAKLFASDTAEIVCSDAIQTLGGAGYMVESEVERIYRDGDPHLRGHQ